MLSGSVHATHVVGAGSSRSRGLGLVGHNSFGGQEQTSDGGSVLQSRAGHLNRVGDAGSQQVDVLAGSSV